MAYYIFQYHHIFHIHQKDTKQTIALSGKSLGWSENHFGTPHSHHRPTGSAVLAKLSWVHKHWEITRRKVRIIGGEMCDWGHPVDVSKEILCFIDCVWASIVLMENSVVWIFSVSFPYHRPSKCGQCFLIFF